MNTPLLPDLIETMAGHGFRVADASGIADVKLLLKRQTWNTNRAIVAVTLDPLPSDMRGYLRELRRRVAFRCGFVPFFWGIGIQAIIIAPGIVESGIDPAQHVARVDNQWAIIQSVFLVDSIFRSCRSARTWGQFVTGKFQDAIALVLSRHFPPDAATGGILISEERLQQLLNEARSPQQN